MTTRLTVTTAPPVPALDSTLVFLMPDFHMLPNDCTSRSTCKFAPTPGAIRALCHRRNETIDALRYYYRFPDLTLHVRGCYQRQCERDCLYQVDDVYGAWERLDGGCKRRMHMADHHWNPSTMHWQRGAANNECFMMCDTTYNGHTHPTAEVERARLTHCADADASFPYYAPPSSLARRAPDALCLLQAFVVLFCFAVSLGCQWRAAYIARRARRPFYLHVGKKSACTQVSSTT